MQPPLEIVQYEFFAKFRIRVCWGRLSEIKKKKKKTTPQLLKFILILVAI